MAGEIPQQLVSHFMFTKQRRFFSIGASLEDLQFKSGVSCTTSLTLDFRHVRILDPAARNSSRECFVCWMFQGRGVLERRGHCQKFYEMGAESMLDGILGLFT